MEHLMATHNAAASNKGPHPTGTMLGPPPPGTLPMGIPCVPPAPMDVGMAQQEGIPRVKDNQSDMLKNITISRDATSGSNFQKDKLLALNQSASAGDTRQSSSMPPSGPAPPTNLPQYDPTPISNAKAMDNRRIQDHQMQLMLLEQQNRKRLVCAQGQYNAGMLPSLPQNPKPEAWLGINQQLGPPPQLGGMPPGVLIPPPPADFPGSSAFPSKPKKKRAAPPNPYHDHEQVQRLLDRIRVLEEENDEFKEAQGVPRQPPRYQVFYTINEDSQTYLEPPTWYLGPDDNFHLKGSLPIASKDRYLQSHREVAFYIEKIYSSDGMDEEVKKIVRQGGEMPKPKAESESIKLETDEMVDAAEDFFSQQPNFRAEFPELINALWFPLKAPYIFWYRYRSPTALENLQPRYQELMKLLTGWIEENYLQEYERADALFDNGMVSKDVMKYFIAPGDVIVRKRGKALQGYLATSWCVVKAVTTVRDRWEAHMKSDGEVHKAPMSSWVVSSWTYGFDGDFYRANTSVEFELRAIRNDEEIKITDLNAYPLQFADEETRARLERRGHTFWSCRDKKLVACQEEGDDNALLGTGERYMIDYPTYKMLHSDSPLLKLVVGQAYIPARAISIAGPPDAPNIYLFPSGMVGYNLRQKKWKELNVDRIRDVAWNKQAFEHLVVEPGIKELVQALVTNQISAEKSTDLIENKGNGLVMLLHGGPGTGKTFTAESVAELSEKPLFRVTCGDIGTEPELVEKYLESVLHLGRVWNCVVLLDEADVFLEQRTLNDLTRNALVSIFLRVLEYYDGILILTSNRVGTFDEAFKSRIQLALHYESLNRDQRSTIWTNFFNRLKGLGEKNIDYYDVEGYISILADHEMNGRQIRNAITTARQLAQFQGQDMAYVHLKHVITVASKFDRHLSSIQSGTPEDSSSVRDDETNLSRYTWSDWRKLKINEHEPAADQSEF